VTTLWHALCAIACCSGWETWLCDHSCAASQGKEAELCCLFGTCRVLADAEKKAQHMLKEVGKETEAIRRDLTRAMRDDAKRVQGLEARCAACALSVQKHDG